MSKSKFWIILVLIIIALAIYGYFRAIPEAEDQSHLPKIEISPQSFNFGEIEYGQIVEHSFKVKNSGNEVLEIKKIATSCACTSAEIDKENINPNEEATLVVRYNTGAMSGSHAKGNQERIIYIKSNDPLNPQIEVMIYAYVR